MRSQRQKHRNHDGAEFFKSINWIWRSRIGQRMKILTSPFNGITTEPMDDETNITECVHSLTLYMALIVSSLSDS